MIVNLLPGDVVLTRGSGWFSRLIRLGTRLPGESRTQVNHVGIVVTAGDTDTAEIVESLDKTRRHPLAHQYKGGSSEIAIYRKRTTIMSAKRWQLGVEANKYVGREYGWWKIAAHTLDYMLMLGRPVFRRLTVSGSYPICSWVVARVYEKVLGYSFGVDSKYASPDDIWDDVTTSDEWLEIMPLGRLT